MFEVFSDYHLRVGEVTAEATPPQGHAVGVQRLDATEVGDAKGGQSVRDGASRRQSLPDDLHGALGLARTAGGLVCIGRVFDSIYKAGARPCF